MAKKKQQMDADNSLPLFDRLRTTETHLSNIDAPSKADDPKPTVNDADMLGQMIPRHRLSALLGDRSAIQYASLKNAIMQGGDVGEVVLLDGAVISDWERYRAGVELGMTLRMTPFPGDDPVAFVCSHTLHHIQRSASIRALIVLEMHGLAGRGRPKKVADSATFSDQPIETAVAENLRCLADCSVSLIYKAWDVIQHHLTEAVKTRRLSFNRAQKYIETIKAADLSGQVRSGVLDVETAYLQAQAVIDAGLLQDVRDCNLTIGQAMELGRSMNAGAAVPAVPSQPRTEKEWMARVEQLETQNTELIRQLSEETGDERYHAEITRVEAALTRAVRRAESAEAEVRRLKNIINQTDICTDISLS